MTLVGTIDFKKIYIGELTEYTPDELADITGQAPLFWNDGYLFNTLAAHSKLFDEKLFNEGTLLFTNFIYAKFPNYTAEIKNRHKQPVMILKEHSRAPKIIIQHIKDKKSNETKNH